MFSYKILLLLLLARLRGACALSLLRQRVAAKFRRFGVRAPQYLKSTSSSDQEAENRRRDGKVAEGGSRGTSAWNGEIAASDIINKRQVKFLSTKPDNKPSLSEVISKFEKFGGMVLNVEGLRMVLNTVYANESEFDRALFNASKKMFNASLEMLRESAPFAVAAVSDDKYVLAFKDAKKIKRGVFPGLIRQSKMLKELKPDHAVALFDFKANSKKVQSDQYSEFSILSVIELKHQGANGLSAFTINDYGVIRSPNLLSLSQTQPYFCQGLSYVIRQVWPGLCSCGLTRQEVPLTVVVGKGDATKWKERVRYVRGTLIIPEYCCETFGCRIQNFEKFEAKDEADIVDQTIAVYLDSIFFGLNAAWEASEKMDTKPVCTPLSGRILKVGGEHLYPDGPLAVLATPVSTFRHGNTVVVSQADLFHGLLSGETLLKIRDDLAGRRGTECFWFDEPEKEKVYRVIVKASSCAVHPQAVAPDLTSTALKDIMNGKLDEVDAIKKTLSKVHLAIYKAPVGLITFMQDLRDEYKGIYISSTTASKGKEPLYPLQSLWAAFRALVLELLVPLASKGIVHSDLRPGYDKTSNILVRRLPNHTLEMALIDLDSLLFFKSMPSSISSDGRYVPKEYAMNAVQYLWWQCVILAYVWDKKIDQEALEGKGNQKLSDAIEGFLYHANAAAPAIGGKCSEPLEGSYVPTIDLFSWLLQDDRIKEFLCQTARIKGELGFVEETGGIELIELMLDKVGLYFGSTSK